MRDKCLEDIGNGAGIHKEPLRKLESDTGGIGLTKAPACVCVCDVCVYVYVGTKAACVRIGEKAKDLPDRLRDLEIVVGREERKGLLQGRVLQDVVGDAVGFVDEALLCAYVCVCYV